MCRSLAIALALAASMLGTGATSAVARVKVGESVAVAIASEGGQPRRAGLAWSHVLRHRGAAFLRVHVRRLDLGPDDELRLVDGAGRVVGAYRGELRRHDFWTPAVDDDRVTLELHAGAAGRAPAVVIDRYGHGPTSVGLGIRPQSVCGANQGEDVACYAGTAIAAASRAVGLLLFEQNGFHFACSGFLISSQGHLLTNEHCLSTQAAVDTLEVRFGYQARACGENSARRASVFEGDRLLMTDWATDVALVTLRGRPAREYGYLPLSARSLTAGEPLYLPQYPGADLEKVSVIGCEVSTAETDGRASNTDFGHRCDTEEGSSGSPVLDLAHHVVGVHHVGACGSEGENRAVLMSRIAPLLPAIETVLSLDGGTLIPGAGPGRGQLRLRLRLSLGLSAAGPDPPTQAFTLRIADSDGAFYTATVPAGAFKRSGNDAFAFRDPSGAVASGLRRVRIEPDGPGVLRIAIEGRGLDLTGADRGDISIAIAIGNDGGEGVFVFRPRGRRWANP